MTRIWRRLNRLAYSRARNLVVIGRDMVVLLQERYGVDPESVTYIPLWATEEVERNCQGSREALLGRLELAGKFVVQYSGNMGLWHDMDTIVRAADLLRTEGTIHFLLIGKGMRRASAEALSGRLGLSNVTWLDFVPREQLPETLAACDAALVSFRAGLEGVAVPSKLYGILASGRPVIAQVPAGCEVARVVTEERCGLVVPPGDAAALAAAIRALAADPQGPHVMASRAREAYLARYTLEHAVERFSALWEST